MTLWAIGRTCWPICLVSCLLNLWADIEVHIFQPYLYTRVQCCGQHGALDAKYDITDPSKVKALLREGALFGLTVPLVDNIIPACAIPDFPPQSKMWSQSPGCVNLAYVQDNSQRLVATSVAAKSAFAFLIIPIGGALADAAGRHPVLLAYCLMCMLACVIFMTDTKLCHAWGNTMFLVASALITPCFEAKDAIMAGSIADMLAEDRASKSRALSLLYGCTQLGGLAGFIGAFFALRLHASSYVFLWAICSGISLAIVLFMQFVVPETLPKNLRTAVTAQTFSPLTVYWSFTRLVVMDPVLGILVHIGIVNNIITAGTTAILFPCLLHRGFSQEEAMLPGLVCTLLAALSAFMLARLEKNISPVSRIILGCICLFLSNLFLGPLFKRIGKPAAYIALACIGFAHTLINPTNKFFISTHVREESQARCQSAFGAACRLGGIFGATIWSSCFFDATATGFRAMRPMVASMGLAVWTTCLAFVLQAWQDCRPDQPFASKPAAAPLLNKPLHSYGIP